MSIPEPPLLPVTLDIDDGEVRLFLREGSPRLHAETMHGLLTTLSVDLDPARCRAIIAAMTWQLAWFAQQDATGYGREEAA